MGDPRKTRKKYETPAHPWNKDRIEEERVLLKEYGMSNKKEVYKMRSLLKNFKDQAKNLIALRTSQAEKERQQMLAKLSKMGLLQETSSLDPVLGLSLRDVLERRLQTQVYKKGLAKTVKQARQFIIHGHVTIGEKKVTSPSYILSMQEEGMLNFAVSSKLNDIEHPERFVKEEPKKEEKKDAGKKERKPGKEEVKKRMHKEKPKAEKPKQEAGEKKNE